jgi:hypothetical protein
MPCLMYEPQRGQFPDFQLHPGRGGTGQCRPRQSGVAVGRKGHNFLRQEGRIPFAKRLLGATIGSLEELETVH